MFILYNVQFSLLYVNDTFSGAISAPKPPTIESLLLTVKSGTPAESGIAMKYQLACPSAAYEKLVVPAFHVETVPSCP